MEARYYFSIRYLPEYADNQLLAGRCIIAMHGFLSQERMRAIKNSVGVSFSKWTEQSVGNEIAFISKHEDILTGLSYQPYFSTMVNESLFEISSIARVPTDAPESRFVRNKAIEKIFIGSKRRRIRRGIKRAESQGRGYAPLSEETREFDAFHEIPIQSRSSGQQFVLHIQRQELVDHMDIESCYNAYGFASNDKWQGSVPIITF